jgi:heptosyltransferase III
MTEQRRILILQAHNLGDAVISTALVETIARGLPTAEIDVLTRPEIQPIFANNPFVNKTFTGRFPMGSVRDFGMKEMIALTILMSRMRSRNYTDVVNLAGDFREELVGRFISSRNNWTPAWAINHPCSQVVKRSRVKIANRPVFIPLNNPNIYNAASIMGSAVSGAAGQRSSLYTPSKERIVWNPVGETIGIHPMASQPWRRWEMEKWQFVARQLVESELQVCVFGAPSEANELQRYFGVLDKSRLRIVTGGLSGYFATMSQMRMLLCHDSFASHVAYALGVPTIFLNGANDADAWAPPGARILALGPAMTCYPCFNRPTCFDRSDEFACVRGISIDSVVDAVWSELKRTPNRIRSSVHQPDDEKLILLSGQ